MKTEKQIEGFEETKNCYTCNHLFVKETQERGVTSYINYCKLNKALLKNVGWCPDYEREKNENSKNPSSNRR